jgi:hypothetical protein
MKKSSYTEQRHTSFSCTPMHDGYKSVWLRLKITPNRNTPLRRFVCIVTAPQW